MLAAVRSCVFVAVVRAAADSARTDPCVDCLALGVAVFVGCFAVLGFRP